MLNNKHMNIAFANEKTVGKRFFSTLKTKTPLNLQCNVVNEINCKDCPKCCVGQAGIYSKNRLPKHERAIKKLKINNSTALVEHVKENGHRFDSANLQLNSQYDDKNLETNKCEYQKGSSRIKYSLSKFVASISLINSF